MSSSAPVCILVAAAVASLFSCSAAAHQKHGALLPEPTNLASVAEVWSNATCGEADKPQVFCRLRGRHCGSCHSATPDKRHPPQFAIDNRHDTWWQSPSLAEGLHFESVTFTLDLKQTYQILHVRLRAGPSPRPGTWALEHSLTGDLWQPWHYFAPSLDQCLAHFGASPPLCLTNSSRVSPIDGGEVHVSLSEKMAEEGVELERNKARFVRFRFHKMSSNKLEKARHTSSDMSRRFYYTIRDILIQGRCVCHGHASKCNMTEEGGVCDCEHNTSGRECEHCLPLYNQERWRAATGKDAHPCVRCNCHGHSTQCRYESVMAEGRTSLNTRGRPSGGGVCINCSKHTDGPNCEGCREGWYRPAGTRAASQLPCLPCDCHGLGSTGLCASHGDPTKEPGSCECRPGFTGPKCDRCAPGYKDFPFCKSCSCDTRGMLSGTSCDSQCFCKVNVEGDSCDGCREGYFFLDQDNPDGCTQCYCSHVTKHCSPAQGYKLKEVTEMKGWLVSDLSTLLLIQPYHRDPDSSSISVADNQLPGVHSYFWMAPPAYRGNRLTSFGSSVTFTVGWDVMRGDTSGKPTSGPDLVLIGENGLKLGYGNTWHKSKNMTITVPLTEEGWYQVSEEEDDMAEEMRRGEVGREELLSVLAHLKHLLVRAKFHTDQAEGSLDMCILETGVRSSEKESGGSPELELPSLEECHCPEGYTGLSCESCDYGYGRITHQGPQLRHHPICTKCNCHGHAPTCNTLSGQCAKCEHNTTGPLCEQCMEGYYGDASVGRPTDCQRCACPLEEVSNNFSPLCEPDQEDFVCTKCPSGYTGRHCEQCEAGYYGNPRSPGSKCRPCQCNDGPCDMSGQCLSCHGNTEGPKCDRCKPHHYGSPLTTGCFPCECSTIGAVPGLACDTTTGQCECKERFTARACDKCQSGLGNITAECPSCDCDRPGSISSLCDPVTGFCDCRPGVTGPICDSCLPHHYGYSPSGCTECGCHPLGSEGQSCDQGTGICSCKKNVVGRTCSICESGYWGLAISGCVPCQCDPLGSQEHGCDQTSGQCYCKAGVGGLSCDHCLPHFYNMSIAGCSECERCELAGHVCDPDTGLCVCPPYTSGEACEECLPNTWGFHPQLGCKACNCDGHGSQSGRCDPGTGTCLCLEGYEGPKCSSCARGYFGYPACQRCGCDLAGTLSHDCEHGLCLCDVLGQCPCKPNVEGLRCDQCKRGTFGMSTENVMGCTECFCFGRSSECTEAGLVWSQIRIPRPRKLTISYDNDTSLTSNTYPVDTQEICYINLAMPGGIVKNGDKQLNITNNLRIIPSDEGDVELGVSYLFDTPVYWQLPRHFLGDKVLSYGGFLKFSVETKGESTLFPPAVLGTYPLIQLQGNDRIILEHFPLISSPSSTRHHVRLEESLWKMKNNPEDVVSRETMMVALQNLQHILIRASDSVDFTEATLRDVTLESGVPGRGSTHRASGIELCSCPSKYNATSCQDPGLGFFRSRPSTASSSTIIIQLVGEATPCLCHGRSPLCHPETGHCTDCAEQTGGPHCEACAEGYYGDPLEGEPCRPCSCPREDRNFAISCEHEEFDGRTICNCRQGYSGEFCDRCSGGWYGEPEREGGSCQPCRCNQFGSVSDECDPETGSCSCKPHVTGRDCSECGLPRHVLADQQGCSVCEDPCVTKLLDRMEELLGHVELNTSELVRGSVAPPVELLASFTERLHEVNLTWVRSRHNLHLFEQLNNNIEKEFRMKIKHLHNKIKKIMKKGENSMESAKELRTNFETLDSQIVAVNNEISGSINRLEKYVEGDREQISISAMLLEAKQVLARVRDTDLETSKNRATELVRLCNNTINDLKYIIGDRNEIEQLYSRLYELWRKLDDVERISSETTVKKEQVLKTIDENKNNSYLLKDTIQDIENVYDEANKILNATKYSIEIGKVDTQEAEDNLQAVISLKNAIHIATRSIEKRANILSHRNEQYLSQYVIPAQQHADELINITDKYNSMFQTDVGVAMRASKAYQDIIDDLQEAQEAVKNATIAADIAHEKAYPGIGTDSLLDKASASKEISIELKRRAEDQMDRVDALYPELSSYGDSLGKLTDKVQFSFAEDHAINKQLSELSNQSYAVRDSSLETVIGCDKVMEASQDVEEELSYLTDNISNRLRPWVRQLESDGELSLNSALDILDEAQANSKKAQDMVERMTFGLNKQTRHFSEWNDTIASKLEALRNKIRQAHHVANSIRLSMTSIGESGGSCVRTYTPSHLEPSTMTTVQLTYAISSQLRDALLFYLPSSTTSDFVAIEMVNRKMRFVWNMGGGLGEVTHPLHIQTAGDLSKDQHWYKVEAHRVLNVGELRVRPVVLPAGSPLEDGSPVSNSSMAGVGRLDVTRGDRVWVGGADRRVSALTSTQSGLVGCLHTLHLNGRPIGLWDFSTQNPSSCTACVEGAEEVKDESSYNFAGDGYAVLQHDSASAYNKYLFSVSLSFRTFDSNALLFIGVGTDEEKFVSLTLRDGRVVFRIGYDGDTTLEMSSLVRYNHGNWTRVEASRYYDRKKKIEKGVVKVGLEVKEGAPSPPPHSDMIPDMSSALYYIGGTPPGVHLQGVPGPFLGCMKDLQIDQGGYSLLKGQYWGVQPSCANKAITVAGFHGNGYVELPSHSMKKKDSFGFVFSTSQRDALLMLSTFEGLRWPSTYSVEDNDEVTNTIGVEDRLSYYSVSLRRGQVEVRLNGGRGEVRLASISSDYSDSRYHTLTLIKTGRRLELRVDDSLDAAALLPEGPFTLKAPGQAGGLYFGGTPSSMNTTGRTFSSTPLTGTIKDVIFNDKIFGFDNPISFEGVTIGRAGPSDSDPDSLLSRGVAGCRKISSYTLEPGAVKFGDEPFSFVELNFRRRAILQKNFTLELDFRTFYPNGLLFLIPGVRGKQPHYLMAALRNGRVQIVLKGRRKIETTGQAVFNDGVWHKMKLEKEERKMTLKVDSIDPEKTKSPKKMNVGGVMYIGGLPESGAMVPHPLLSRLEGFKGCVRGLRMNGHEEHLVSEKSTRTGVGQCFPQVERGSYFPGDAYAVYKNKFNVGTLLELELEFRTSEMNGVLLSVSEPQGYPALSLELHNGKVVMCGDMGDRRPFRLEQGLATVFAACDNRWHRIHATYLNDQLTLRVDNLDQSYWLSDNGHLTAATTSSPLYIGGLPESASSGTLETRENFKGCIRNVVMSGERRDWTGMAYLHNILLSSCPLAG